MASSSSKRKGIKRSSSGGPRELPGSSSGGGREHPGDPPTDLIIESISGGGIDGYKCIGARVRVVGEVKNSIIWGEANCAVSKDFTFDISLSGNSFEWFGVITDTAMAKVVVMLVHDLIQKYSNPNCPADKLNIDVAEIWIRLQREDKEFINKKSFIGPDELEKYLLEHPLSVERSEWKRLDTPRCKELRMEIKKHGRKFYDVLTAAIDKDISVAGRRRKDEAQILESVQHMEEIDPKEKEIQDLKERMSSLELKTAGELRAKDTELKDAKLRIEDAERRAEDAERRAEDAERRAEDADQRAQARTGILTPNTSIAEDGSRVGCERQGEAQILDSVHHGEESNLEDDSIYNELSPLDVDLQNDDLIYNELSPLDDIFRMMT